MICENIFDFYNVDDLKFKIEKERNKKTYKIILKMKKGTKTYKKIVEDINKKDLLLYIDAIMSYAENDYEDEMSKLILINCML